MLTTADDVGFIVTETLKEPGARANPLALGRGSRRAGRTYELISGKSDPATTESVADKSANDSSLGDDEQKGAQADEDSTAADGAVVAGPAAQGLGKGRGGEVANRGPRYVCSACCRVMAAQYTSGLHLFWQGACFPCSSLGGQ
jgi:hypothetical protein